MKAKITIGVDGKVRLADGRELIKKNDAAKLLQVSRETFSRMSRGSADITDLFPEFKTRMVLLDEVEALKAAREEKEASGTEEARAATAKRARKYADITKAHGKVAAMIDGLLLTQDLVAAVAIITTHVDALRAWEPDFLPILQHGGDERFRNELADVLDGAGEELAKLVPKMRGEPVEGLLELGERPPADDFPTVKSAMILIDILKTQQTQLEAAEQDRQVTPAVTARFKLGTAAAWTLAQLENIRLRLIPYVAKAERPALRKGMRTAIHALREAVLEDMEPGPLRGEWDLKFSPPSDLSGSEWVETYRVLPPEAAEPGPMKLDKTPVFREILDCLTSDETSEVTAMVAAQCGKSEFLNSAAAIFAAREPSAQLLVQPNLEQAEGYVRERIRPMFDLTPELASRIEEVDSNIKGKSVQQARTLQYAGGQINAVGANAPASLASRAVKVLLCDEIDRWPLTIGVEGDPVALVRLRTLTFESAGRRILMVSTPTVSGTSKIETAFNAGTQERWHVPCPYGCGEEHIPSPDYLKWEVDEQGKGLPETAVYVMPCCGCIVDSDAQRMDMIRTGHWVAENPRVGLQHRSFQACGLVSGFTSHTEMARELIAAESDPLAQRAVRNTIYGEPYVDTANNVDEDGVINRIESFSLDNIPPEVALITVGADVQADRIESVWHGWDEGNRMYVLGHRITFGSPEDGATWDQFEELIQREWQHPYGGTIMASAVAIDSGYSTANVARFCAGRRYGPLRFAIKGQGGEGVPIWKISTSKTSHAAKASTTLHNVGTHQCKSAIMHALQKPVAAGGDDVAPGAVRIGDIETHVSRVEFVHQLLSEARAVKVKVDGTQVVSWVRKANRRAEILDATVYSYAVFYGVFAHTANWEKRREALRPAPDEPDESTWAPMPTGDTATTSASTPASASGYDPNAWGSFG